MKDSLLEPGLAAGMDIHAVPGLQLFAAPRLAAQILFLCWEGKDTQS